MDPIQSTSHSFMPLDLTQALPRELFSEISSFLSQEDLGRLASVSQFFNHTEISNLMWKKLVSEQLPLSYQNLPCVILKEKFKCYHNFLKNKVNLALDNLIDMFGLPILSEEFIDQLKSKDLSLEDKWSAIRNNQKLIRTVNDAFTSIVHFNINMVFFDYYFNKALKVVDLNKPHLGATYPYLFRAMEGKKGEVAKCLIDAGADFNVCVNGVSLAEFLQNNADAKGISFPQQLYDEIKAYAAQKAAKANNNSSF